MKIGRFIVNLLRHNSYTATLKRRKHYPSFDLFERKLNIPYINDNNPYHTFDIFYGNSEKKKNCCVIDIHGGAYIFGEHFDNYILGVPFLEQGYDFVTIDYVHNDGTKDTIDLANDIYKNIKYLLDNKKELNIENDVFVLTGDSAGGHFALLFSELIKDEGFAKELGYEFKDMNLIACLANCPVYDFAHISEGNLTRSGMKRMFGPNYNDQKAFELLCPRVHLSSLNLPVLTSTCKKDFLRSQSLLLREEFKDKPYPFKFVDIQSGRKGIGHVHNVLHPEYEESIEVNNAMIAFIESNLKLDK